VDLRQVMCGGETLTPALQVRFSRRLRSRLYHMYGPTEASVDAASWPCGGPASSHVPIGRPVACTQLHILDAHLNPVPIGVPGHLHIGGLGLARGYLDAAGLTAERFVPDPVGVRRGQRLYRSGDMARYRADGAIEFLGRRDRQVKLHGQRVELEEVEARVAAHPGVNGAAVVVDDRDGGQLLVAYFTAVHGSDVTSADLRAFLKELLPIHMIPTTYIRLAELPRTSSGKIDRRALPTPPRTRASLETAFVAPRTPVEATVALIWAEMLGVDHVGIHDDFFDLGGHSVLAMQVMARVKETLSIDAPILAALFQTPTIAGVVAALEDDAAGPPQIVPTDEVVSPIS
jgi:nonribosomal peptide synthetase DhbF